MKRRTTIQCSQTLSTELSRACFGGCIGGSLGASGPSSSLEGNSSWLSLHLASTIRGLDPGGVPGLAWARRGLQGIFLVPTPQTGPIETRFVDFPPFTLLCQRPPQKKVQGYRKGASNLQNTPILSTPQNPPSSSFTHSVAQDLLLSIRNNALLLYENSLLTPLLFYFLNFFVVGVGSNYPFFFFCHRRPDQT